MAGGQSPVPDDPSIPDDSLAYRRITPHWVHVDELNPAGRLSSRAFQDHPDAVSVALRIELVARNLGPADLLSGWDGYGVVSLPVAFLRECGLGVVCDPTSGEPWHALVWGNKSPGTRKKLARAATWIIRPGD